MDEVWKDIVGYEGLYQVSNHGRIKSLRRDIMMNQFISHNGYYMIFLFKNGKSKGFRVSRLVAQAFIENRLGLPCVNHKDEIKTNNFALNLEWCTYKYNRNYGSLIERMSIAQINNPKTSTPVAQYSIDGSLIRTYPSIREANRVTGLDRSGISNAVKGGVLDNRGYTRSRGGKYGGYIWRKYK